MEKGWAIVDENKQLLDYIEASSADEAVEALVKKWSIPPADGELLGAIPADIGRADVRIAGGLLSALEYGAEFAFGGREGDPFAWGEYQQALGLLERKGIQPSLICGWVRVNTDLDLWSPVLE